MSGDAWYRDRAALRFIVLRYLPLFVAISFAWEWAHVPLYTIWHEASLASIAFAVAHCTLGDALIGASALLLALILGREGRLSQWHWPRVGALSALAGTGYTIFSEWINVTIIRSWTYAESMPKIGLGGFEIGVTPLAQWLVLPPLALYLARRARSETAAG